MGWCARRADFEMEIIASQAIGCFYIGFMHWMSGRSQGAAKSAEPGADRACPAHCNRPAPSRKACSGSRLVCRGRSARRIGWRRRPSACSRRLPCAAVPCRTELARHSAMRAADHAGAARPGSRPALPDLRHGRRRQQRPAINGPAPRATARRSTRTPMNWRAASVYSCGYSGAVSDPDRRRAVGAHLVEHGRRQRHRVPPAAKARLGTWDTPLRRRLGRLAGRAAATGRPCPTC